MRLPTVLALFFFAVVVVALVRQNSRAGPSDIAEWRDAKVLVRKTSGAAKAFLSHRRHLLKAVSRSLRDRTMRRDNYTSTFTVDNDVFGTQTVLFTRQVLSPADCRTIVDSAERVSKRRGYTTRGAGVTTRDQRVGNLPRGVQDNIYRALRSCIRQYAESVDMDHPDYDEMFPGKRSFVIRYDGGVEGKNDCKPHYDCDDLQSVSVVINLSAPEEYAGGGTELYEQSGASAKVACPRRGQGVVFNGSKNLHGGAPVTSGVRFVLVALFEKRFNFFSRLLPF